MPWNFNLLLTLSKTAPFFLCLCLLSHKKFSNKMEAKELCLLLLTIMCIHSIASDMSESKEFYKQTLQFRFEEDLEPLNTFNKKLWTMANIVDLDDGKARRFHVKNTVSIFIFISNRFWQITIINFFFLIKLESNFFSYEMKIIIFSVLYFRIKIQPP